MKKFTYTLLLLFSISTLKSQLILFQDFPAGNGPNWGLSNGASVGLYSNGLNSCNSDYGIITPGVGGNNPAKVLSEVVTPNQQIVEVKFSISRYDANLDCASMSNFGCPTYVDILAVGSTYTGNDPIGDGALIYANYTGYLLPIAGGNVSLNITLPANLPPFKVFFNFSTPGNCNQGGTKYVLDKFTFTGLTPCQVANTCAPIANNDYFDAALQSFTNSALLANVYGTNLNYTPSGANVNNVTRSLTNVGFSPEGGVDYDIDNTPLANMNFNLLTQNFTAADASFTFNSDGTFTFNRINTSMSSFQFTYRLTAPNALFDDATVRILFGTGGPLPVKLLFFDAAKTSNGINLSWQTAFESNNKGFEVFRKTGVSFEKITFVNSKAPGGNSTSQIEYNFTDNGKFTEKVIYYRLKQIDLDGKETISEIKAVNNGGLKQPVLVYPNPSRGEVNIILANSGNHSVDVINSNGASVYSQKNAVNKRLIISNLKTGVYSVRIVNNSDNSVSVQKLIVQ